MTKALKKKWVAALRSGKYKQGTNRLFNKQDGTYCCLGVGARLVKPNARLTKVGRFAGCNNRQVDDVAVLLGIEFRKAEFLAIQNDNGVSFVDIADHIEKAL